MISVRLTNVIREQIAKNALIKSGVIAELEAIDRRKGQLALDARVFAFGGTDKVREIDCIVKKLEKMGSDARKLGASIYVSANKNYGIDMAIGGRRLGRVSYGVDSKGDSIALVTPEREKCLFAADHEISLKFDILLAEQSIANKRKEDIEKTVWAALNSVTTLKRLIDVWPESQELIPEKAGSVNAALPALKVEDLNKMIGLPTSEAA
ncbi:hypothetical protein BTJ39_22480 [Izhakiella australiensis]|uniref:Nucleotide modification associated domain-containing protein n=1 Tax=Izhakiella australiensis TaxID=1926881 RepID=A0A1S8YAC5_9GAMM|nr:Nmad5 family putative nucleotide modification protein [Izhakiella australiensis]OON35643.1 hypothetical protein BTJ39_22480 [Izhakiella australiensis]